MRKPTYISTDVEYSWDSQEEKWQWSLLALWSCELGNINNSFYRELQPINRIYNEAAMKAIAPWFQFIWSNVDEVEGCQILDRLQEYGMPPQMAMTEYQEWLWKFASQNIREIACPIKFDGGLTSYYFREFTRGRNPLTHSWEDGNSLLRGFLWDTSTSFRKLGIEGLGWELPHNALRDSQIQSIWIEFLLKLMQDNTVSGWELTALYMKSWKENLLTSQWVRNYVTWVGDSVAAIRNTPFWEEVEYSSIL